MAMVVRTPSDRRIATATTDYPLYPALWHLATIGLLDETGRPTLASLDQKRAVRVAVIDTSVAVTHPCLTDSIDTARCVDFASTRLGSFAYLESKLPAGLVSMPAREFRDLPIVGDLAAELEARLASDRPARLGVLPVTGELFSSHGTATAGLIAARPVVAKRRVPTGIDTPATTDIDQPLPYCGAHPHAKIMAISTSFDPDPEQLILALLAAAMMGADVILLARDVPDPRKDSERPAPLLTATDQVPPTAEELAKWDALEGFLVWLSRRIPIVCAAGNGNEPGCVYPANLCREDNGLISVGAVNARGWLTSYSATGALVHAPSSDGERYDRDEVRLDPRAPEDHQPGVPPGHYSPRGIITTDVPGKGGYSGSGYRDKPLKGGVLREIGSYFCTFGGTSAASAIACGFLAAGIGAGRLEWPSNDAGRGRAAREWLLANSVPSPSDSRLRVLALDGQLRLPPDSDPAVTS
jgi:subtilisin family serine protease